VLRKVLKQDQSFVLPKVLKQDHSFALLENSSHHKTQPTCFYLFKMSSSDSDEDLPTSSGGGRGTPKSELPFWAKGFSWSKAIVLDERTLSKEIMKQKPLEDGTFRTRGNRKPSEAEMIAKSFYTFRGSFYETNSSSWRIFFTCNGCQTVKAEKPGKGWGNFRGHLPDCIGDDVFKANLQTAKDNFDKNSGQLTIFTSFGVSEENKDVHGLMEWLVMANMPIESLRNDFHRKSSIFKKNWKSPDIMRKYISHTGRLVEEKIKKDLAEKFALLTDAWTRGGVHYLAIFASYCDNEGAVVCRLLSISPLYDVPDVGEGTVHITDDPMETTMGEATRFNAKAHADHIRFILAEYYGRQELEGGTFVAQQWVPVLRNTSHFIPFPA
jgi:hypothetical protein